MIDVSDEYNVSMEEALLRFGEEGIQGIFQKYKPNIIKRSSQCRKNYWKYICKIKADKAEKIAIIDIVTHGTLVYGLSNIFRRKIDLLALGTVGVPNKYIKDIKDVSTIYGNVLEIDNSVFYSFSVLSELFLFLEMLYGSTEGQLFEISKDGIPILLQGTEYNAELLYNTQDAMRFIINKLGDNYYKMMISKEFALAFLKLFFHKYSDKSEEIVSQFTFHEPYAGNNQKYNLMEELSH